MILQAIWNKIKEIQHYIVSNGGLKQLFSNLTNVLLINFKEITSKLQNLAQTNFELGLYHFEHMNLSDAIMRFKILKYFNYENGDISYYIGRCYFEKLNYPKAQKYLDEYVRNTDSQFREEALFCLNIIAGRLELITSIPKSILKRHFNKLAKDYDKLYINNRDTSPQLSLFRSLHNITYSSYKPFDNNILDIGCGTGIIGDMCRRERLANMIVGVDISHKMLEISSSLFFENKHVYNRLVLQDAENYLTEAQEKQLAQYDIIVASNLITYYNNINQLFLVSNTITSDDGLIFITFKVAKNKEIEFYSRNEQFYYLPEHVEKYANLNGWYLLHKEEILFTDGEGGMLTVFSKTESKSVRNVAEILVKSNNLN